MSLTSVRKYAEAVRRQAGRYFQALADLAAVQDDAKRAPDGVVDPAWARRLLPAFAVIEARSSLLAAVSPAPPAAGALQALLEQIDTESRGMVRDWVHAYQHVD